MPLSFSTSGLGNYQIGWLAIDKGDMTEWCIMYILTTWDFSSSSKSQT
ncbi:uncharacterized protein FIBRA_08386 [Fibroporia radiculosa]|uniref:Uncharacterized protein n=1 Tax=Fibroporia radiculosa TaxID=599839 RepID=J4ICB8_9APHY|nr:uncharacterized protein FIBRA_08386 [Fibroporia radiculosa]CCM06136.1 predicted protein [Fibroporia radiculosa]